MAGICIITPGQRGANAGVVKEANARAKGGDVVNVGGKRERAAGEGRDQAGRANGRCKGGR